MQYYNYYYGRKRREAAPSPSSSSCKCPSSSDGYDQGYYAGYSYAQIFNFYKDYSGNYNDPCLSCEYIPSNE